MWWDKSIEISPVRRLAKLFDELLLPNISQHIVIFLDEIDSILRALHNTLEYNREINQLKDNGRVEKQVFSLMDSDRFNSFLNKVAS